MAIALRIEHELDKSRILEEYLSRVEFGPNLRGIEAASGYYFDKPARELSLAEAAALVSLPRGPSLYDPRRGTERLLRRRDRVLERLRGLELVDPAAIDRALATPLVLSRAQAAGGVEHFARALLQGKLAGDSADERRSGPRSTEICSVRSRRCRAARSSSSRLSEPRRSRCSWWTTRAAKCSRTWALPSSSRRSAGRTTGPAPFASRGRR